MPLAAQSVVAAATRIEPYIEHTRVLFSQELSRVAGTGVWLKLENEQRTGSFKVRGAMNVLGSLDQHTLARGIIASSAGNHGLGVACAAREFGAEATIFIPSNAPRVKRDGILGLGAHVDESQPHYDAAMDAAKSLAAQRGATYVNPCLGDALLAGQGTVAMEVLEQRPAVRNLVLGVGGGGLLGGCASLLRERAPSVRIIGAQSVNTAAMAKSIAAGRVVEIENLPTLADGLAGQIDQDALDIGRHGLDDIVTVREEDIGHAILWLLDHHGLKVEGAGAVGVAALLTGAVRVTGETVIVISGGNIDDARIENLRGRFSGQQ